MADIERELQSADEALDEISANDVEGHSFEDEGGDQENGISTTGGMCAE